MKTLKDPDASKRLVDTLVKEDPTTGQAAINIPVSGKETVLQFVANLAKYWVIIVFVLIVYGIPMMPLIKSIARFDRRPLRAFCSCFARLS